MGSLRIVTALVSTIFALLLIVQLLSTFGFPRFELLHMRYQTTFDYSQSQQIPISLPGQNLTASDDEHQYLLGVGKADITG